MIEGRPSPFIGGRNSSAREPMIEAGDNYAIYRLPLLRDSKPRCEEPDDIRDDCTWQVFGADGNPVNQVCP